MFENDLTLNFGSEDGGRLPRIMQTKIANGIHMGQSEFRCYEKQNSYKYSSRCGVEIAQHEANVARVSSSRRVIGARCVEKRQQALIFAMKNKYNCLKGASCHALGRNEAI